MVKVEVISQRRLKSSVYGNPRWELNVKFPNGNIGKLRTTINSSIGYYLTDHERFLVVDIKMNRGYFNILEAHRINE